jgi:O-antigen/teichoic acid export membrane protein
MRAIFDKIKIMLQAEDKKRFYSAVLFGTLSAVISQGLNFLALMLITRKIGEENIGHFSIIQSTVVMLLTFGILGQNVSSAALTARFKKNNPAKLGQIIGNSYLLALSMMAIISIFTILTADYLFNEIFLDYSHKAVSIGILILWTTTMTLDMMQVSSLIGFEAYRDLIKTDVIKGIISIAVVYPLTIRFGLLGTLPGYLFSSSLGLLTNHYFLRKHLKLLCVRIIWKFSLDIIKTILNIGLPIFIASLLIGFTTWLTNKIVFNDLSGPTVLGIIFVCRQLLALLQFIPVQISKVLLPIIAEDNRDRARMSIMKNSLLAGVSISILFSLIGLIFQDKILIIYKLDPVLSSLPFQITMITVVFSAINLILGQFVIAGKNPWIRTGADLIISSVLLIMTMVLKSDYIYIALPCAMLIATILSDILLVLYLRGRSLPENLLNSEPV